LEFGDINENNLRSTTKFGHPIKVITTKDIADNQMQDYLGVGDWSPVNNKLRFQLYYPIEGITINYLLEKADKEWKLINSIIMVE